MKIKLKQQLEKSIAEIDVEKFTAALNDAWCGPYVQLLVDKLMSRRRDVRELQLQAVIDGFADLPSSSVRGWVLLEFGRLTDYPEIAKELITLGAKDGNAGVRLAAVRAAGEQQYPEADIQAMIDAEINGRTRIEMVRESSIVLIRSLPSQFFGDESEAAQTRLVELAQSADWEVAWEAFRTLTDQKYRGRIKVETLPAFKHVLSQATDPKVKYRISEKTFMLKDSEEAFYRFALNDTDPKTRLRAFQKLLRIILPEDDRAGELATELEKFVTKESDAEVRKFMDSDLTRYRSGMD